MKDQQTKSSFIMTVISAALFFLILAVFGKTQAAGLLKPKNGDPSLVSIKSHAVSVIINNGFARTEVDQVFVNSGDQDLEALYTFPLPREASLSELSLWIDGKERVGEVLEKQRARKIYEEQKVKGKDTALAQKDDFKSFDVSVYPVRARGETRVRLVYYQPLHIDSNIGRYVYPLAEGGVDDERIRFWSVDAGIREAFTFDLYLKSVHPVREVRMPGYMNEALIEKPSAETEEGSEQSYHARLDLSEGADLDKDIVFYYRLDEKTPARVEIVPYREAGAGEGSFMLTITPGASLAPISEGVDWVFVLDRSGSMSGGKIRTLVDGVARVISKMSPADRFRIVTFNNSASDLTGGFVSATESNVQRYIEKVKSIQADGGTALYAGLSRGLDGMDDDRTTSVILVTDGVANVGPTYHADFLNLVAEKDVRLFTFVIGNSSNRPLLDSLTKASGGFAMDISEYDDIYGRILQAKNKVLHEALHGVEVKITGGEIVDLTPVSPGSLYHGQQLVMFGKYLKPGPVSISLHAKISGKDQTWHCDAVLPDEDIDNPEIERLWALSSIEELMEEVRINGESEKLRGKIVDLATKYSLVTDYTSMLVLDDQEMETAGIRRNNSDRVQKERKAQKKRFSRPVKNYRVDSKPEKSMFRGATSPGIGSGPVGPWFLFILFGGCWVLRRKNVFGNMQNSSERQ